MLGGTISLEEAFCGCLNSFYTFRLFWTFPRLRTFPFKPKGSLWISLLLFLGDMTGTSELDWIINGHVECVLIPAFLFKGSCSCDFSSLFPGAEHASTTFYPGSGPNATLPLELSFGKKIHNARFSRIPRWDFLPGRIWTSRRHWCNPWIEYDRDIWNRVKLFVARLNLDPLV